MDNFVPRISLETPLEDYKKIYMEKLETDEFIEDEILQEIKDKLFAKTRDVIWKLLFQEQQPKPENLKKAADFLYQYKTDACFHNPWDYNDWIPKVRDELLKRKMFDFWREEVVAKQLGPCWAWDSDYFDDMEDVPEEFYAHAGCTAPFKKIDKNEEVVSEVIAATIAEERRVNDALIERKNEAASTEQTDFLPKISLETPLDDYKNLCEEKLGSDDCIDDDEMQQNFAKIAAKMREIIWSLLFSEEPAKEENLKKAVDCLTQYKMDACFHNPWDYNDWIPKVRDELLKRKMFDFWREHIVAKELGPCWARDSDFFDDDDTPEEFYKHAGCVAPFSDEAKKNAEIKTK